MPKQKPQSAEKDIAELEKQSAELKARIEEAKKRVDAPLDEALGNPDWEQRAADRHLDRPDDEGEE
jgi:hypothetical protein